MVALRRAVGLVAVIALTLLALACAAQPPAPAEKAAQPAAPAPQPAASAGQTTAPAKAAQPAAPAKAKEPVTIRVGSLPHVESWADALLVKKVLETAYPYIKVELTGFPGGPPVIAGMLSGQLDAGVIVGETPAVVGMDGKGPFKIVTSYGWAQRHHGLIVPVNSPIKSVADLKGKRVAFQLGTSTDEFAGAILKEKAGLSMNDISVVNMEIPNAAVALKAGQVDAAVLDSALMQKAISEGVGRLVQDGRGTSWANTFGTVMHNDFIKNRPVEARRLVEAFRLEQEFQHEHAVLVAELYQRDREKITFEDSLAAITAFPRYPAITDPATVATFQRIADFLYANKRIKSQLDVAKSGYIYTALYEEAEKRLGKFPFERGAEMKVNTSEKGKNIDEALKPYIDRLVKADPD